MTKILIWLTTFAFLASVTVPAEAVKPRKCKNTQIGDTMPCIGKPKKPA